MGYKLLGWPGIGSPPWLRRAEETLVSLSKPRRMSKCYRNFQGSFMELAYKIVCVLRKKIDNTFMFDGRARRRGRGQQSPSSLSRFCI